MCSWNFSFHATDHHALLVVLLAEHRHARLHAAEQLHHHGAHAGEKARSEVAFEHIGQRRIGQHPEGLRLGVQLGLVGREQQVAAGRLQQFAVTRQRARVTIEVFVRRELKPVHEDAGHQRQAVAARLAQQAQMPLVQVAHGGHEGTGAGAAQGGTQRFGGVQDLHARQGESDRVNQAG